LRGEFGALKLRLVMLGEAMQALKSHQVFQRGAGRTQV
jgi:hypothetical protein